MSGELLPSDELTTRQENELICEKLLGWKPQRRTVAGLVHVAWWDRGAGRSDTETTPVFTTWAEAGLILDALAAKKAYPVVGRCATVWTCTAHAKPRMDEVAGCEESAPLAIRAAALAYIRSRS